MFLVPVALTIILILLDGKFSPDYSIAFSW